jgi:hypothetical protein
MHAAANQAAAEAAQGILSSTATATDAPWQTLHKIALLPITCQLFGPSLALH